jgi:phosphoserine phosphatase RsbU/P
LLEYENNDLTGANISSLLTISGRIFYQTHLYPLVKLHHHFEEVFLNLQTSSKADIPVVMNAVAIQTGDLPQILCSFIPVFNRRKYEDEILLARKIAEEAMDQNEGLQKVRHELEHQQIAMDKQIRLLTFQNKELLQLSDIITHDLQEPVRKLMLFSTQLLQENTNVNIKNRAPSAISASSRKIKTLLQNLEKYLGLTVIGPVKDHINLGEIVQVELAELKMIYPDIKVHVSCDELPTITGDPKQLTQMIHHLLRNAFDHGTIDNHLSLQIQAVVVKENGFSSMEDRYKYLNHLKLTIRDSGPGFEAQYKDYIFSVLKKLDINGNTAGFGLAFCKRIAENHFGRISAEAANGKGAAFTILLPLE